MSITVQFDFDTAWATRIATMVDSEMCRHIIMHSDIAQALLDSLTLTYDDLTAKQQWKLIVLLDTLEKLQQYEGRAAADAAAQVIIDDISNNFPLEVGDA